MINRRSFVKLAAAGAAAGSFGMPWIARAARPITLKLADSLPTTHYSMPIIKHWIKQIEDGTEGRIRFEHYPAEQLASARDLLDAVQTRIADVAYIPAQYFSEKLPMATVGSLPIPEIKADIYALEAAYYEIGLGILDEVEFRDAGIRALRASSTEAYNLHMVSRKIVTLDDLSGQKIRVGGNVQQQAITALGGIPVTVTPPEIYNAMQNGTLDGTVFHIPSIHSYKLNDLVRYSTDNLNLGVFNSYYAMNRDLWDDLPPDIQAVFDKVGRDLIRFEGDTISRQSDTWRQEFRDQGIEVYDLAPEVIDETTRRLTPIRQKWAELYESRNLPAERVVDAWVAALKKHART